MASSPPASPQSALQRFFSETVKAGRSPSRMSVGSKIGGGSRASDEESKTSVKVGKQAFNRQPTGPSRRHGSEKETE